MNGLGWAGLTWLAAFLPRRLPLSAEEWAYGVLIIGVLCIAASHCHFLCSPTGSRVLVLDRLYESGRHFLNVRSIEAALRRQLPGAEVRVAYMEVRRKGAAYDRTAQGLLGFLA